MSPSVLASRYYFHVRRLCNTISVFSCSTRSANKRSLARNPFIIEHVRICVFSIVVTPRLDK
jgi:hypothetical protein